MSRAAFIFDARVSRGPNRLRSTSRADKCRHDEDAKQDKQNTATISRYMHPK
jgi:hypothetical protein